MYKSRWSIESFFHWIKQNLKVHVLFGTTKNAVFNQNCSQRLLICLFEIFIHKEIRKITQNPYHSQVSNACFFVLMFTEKSIYGNFMVILIKVVKK
ncbi:transposase [Lysinibacillus xylanilyticus]|uniref:transposase n=1 Tax=Lysinibacillus xylanilyticus TaxID=582475 RepID=UPI003CFD74B2